MDVNREPPPKIVRTVCSEFRTFACAGFVLGIPALRLRNWCENGYKNEQLTMLRFGLEEHIRRMESLKDELDIIMRRNWKLSGFVYPPEH